jgi:hypothetical protein
MRTIPHATSQQANLYLQHSALASATLPAGAPFGPIAGTWPLRRHKLGAQAATWAASDLYAGLSLRISTSPSSTTHRTISSSITFPTELACCSRISIETRQLVEFALPLLRPWLTVERAGSFVEEATAEELPTMRCDTLTIDTDRSVVTVVWRTQVALEQPDEPGRVLVSLDPLGTSLVAQAAGGAPIATALASTWPKAESTGLPFRKLSGVEGLLPSAPRSQGWPSRPPPALAVAAACGSAHGGACRGARGGACPQCPWQCLPPCAVPAPAAMPPPAAPAWAAPRASYRPPAEQPIVERSASPWVPPEQRGVDGAPAQTIGQQVAKPAEPVKSVAPAPSSEVGLSLARSLRSSVVRCSSSCGSSPRPCHVCVAIRSTPSCSRPWSCARESPSSKTPFRAKSRPRSRTGATSSRSSRERRRSADDRWAATLSSATLVGGRYVPPIVLVAGELALSFDELATLRSTVSVATPLIGADEPLKRAVQDARDFLALPDLLSPASVVEGFTSRIVDAFRKLKRSLPTSYLESHAERAVLERRLYQKRELYGAPHLRAELHLGGSSRPMPAYLPEALAPKLPLYPRFRARLLAELHLSEDPLDAHEASLRVVALGRVVSLAQDSSGAPPR